MGNPGNASLPGVVVQPAQPQLMPPFMAQYPMVMYGHQGIPGGLMPPHLSNNHAALQSNSVLSPSNRQNAVAMQKNVMQAGHHHGHHTGHDINYHSNPMVHHGDESNQTLDLSIKKHKSTGLGSSPPPLMTLSRNSNNVWNEPIVANESGMAMFTTGPRQGNIM